jgi:hypothetical protein
MEIKGYRKGNYIVRVNERIDTFYGVNNLLDPSSAEYREGMAYSADNARINNKGVWTAGLAASGALSGITPIALSGGTGQRQMTLSGTTKIFTTIGTATEGQNGYIYYIDTGALKRYDTSATAVAALTPPTLATVAAASVGAISRMEDGVYYYILTAYHSARKIESLPSTAFEVELDSTSGNTGVNITVPAPAAGTVTRLYRSKRTSPDDSVYNAPNVFYFIEEFTSAQSPYPDVRSDEELLIEYEGRGSVMAAPDFVVSYNDRMLYIDGNDLWWSSSGRPEEVAQKYSITFNAGGTTKSLTSYPKLNNGYGEAKKTIPELAGQIITGAIEKDGKMWVFTPSMMGYISEAYGEGYTFKVHRRGVGCINQYCLQSCEHGVFGFDRQGLWLLDNANRVQRLTDNRIDLSSWFTADTDFHGIWCPDLGEYLMCNGSTAWGYQPARDIFCGAYTWATTAGCSYYDSSNACGVASGATKVVETTGSPVLKFYLGQSSPTTIKQSITVEAVHNTAGSTTVKVGAGVGKTITATDFVTASTAAVRCTTDEVGRMIYTEITITVTPAGEGLTTLNYRYDPIEWSLENGR